MAAVAQEPLIRPAEGKTLLERVTKEGKSIASSSMNLQFYTSAAAYLTDGKLDEAAFKINAVRLEILGSFGKDFSYHSVSLSINTVIRMCLINCHLPWNVRLSTGK